MMTDFFREIDLNPATGPITNPLDLRAMHYFGFLANGQEIRLVQPQTVTAARVALSFHYANQPTITSPTPPPPIDEVVDVVPGPPPLPVRYTVDHDRRHVLVWLDGPVPPAGQPVIVRIKAWAKDKE